MSPTSTPPAASSPVSSPPSPWEPPQPAAPGLAATKPNPPVPPAPLDHPTVWTPTVPAPLSPQPVPLQASPAPYPPQPAYAPLPPRVSPPAPPFAEAGRSRRGPVLLAAGLVAALLVGAFVVVLVLRPGRNDPASAGSTTGPTATSDANGHANADHGIGGTGASSSASPSPSASLSSKASPSSTKTPPNRDDFTVATLDTTMWKKYGSSFSPDMVRVSGGELQVLGSGQDPTGATNKAGGVCWCPDGDHKYGIWQVRAKFDAGAGYQPVIHLWPPSNNVTTDGAIDVAKGSDAARTTLGVALHPAGGGTVGSASVKGNFTTWHVYRVEWRATFVRMYLDGTLIYDSTKSTTPLKIPSTPLHLTIQMDKGPTGGIPSPNAQTPVPVILHVDWVSYSA